MRTWLRLTLIILTVGGGFTGCVLTLQMLLSPQISGPFLSIVCVVFALLYVFICAAGLIFVQNPARIGPLIVALSLQIPVIFSPIVGFRISSGLQTSVGFGENGLFASFRLGSDWQFNLLQPMPWGLGVNLVAIVMLALLYRATPKANLPAPPSSPTTAAA